MRMTIVMPTLLLLCSPALAAGGFSCEARNDGVTLDVQGGVTHGMGAPLFSLTANLTIDDARVADDLRETIFERQHVAQYWLDGNALKLLLYREREGDTAHGYVQVRLLAEEGGGANYGGDYAVSVYEADGGEVASLSGSVSCSVE